MLKKVKERAGVVALGIAMIALFVALSGTAGALPGRGSIDKNDLKKNVVSSRNVAPDSLTGADIAADSLTGADVAPDALTGADVNEATLVLPAITVVQRTADFGPVASGAAGDGIATCVGNEKAVGGGFTASSGFGRLDGSRPELNAQGVPTGWHVFVGNNSPGPAQFRVYVLCASL